MDISQNVSLLVQVPLIGSFIYFVLRNNLEWREFIKTQNEGFTSTLNKNTLAVEKLSEVMHSVDKNISLVQESQIYTAAALDRNTRILGKEVVINGKTQRIIDFMYESNK